MDRQGNEMVVKYIIVKPVYLFISYPANVC